MTHPNIPLAEQIAAVERAQADRRHTFNKLWGQDAFSSLTHQMEKEIDALAAALATLRGLLLIEETR
mgnify:CR=1 FL=1